MLMELDETLCAVPLPPATARELFVAPLPPGIGEGLFIAPAPASGAPATGVTSANVCVTCCAVGAGK